MKKLFFPFLIVGIFFFSVAERAKADLFSISAGIPFSYNVSNFDDKGNFETDGSPSGTMFHLQFPVFVGIGLENYTQKIKAKSGAGFNTGGDPVEFKIENTIYDIFYTIPFPVLNLTIGGGFGTSKLTCENFNCGSGKRAEITNASITQYYLQLGIPFAEVADVHFSYHNIQTASKGTIDWRNSANSDFIPTGIVMALGLSVGF